VEFETHVPGWLSCEEAPIKLALARFRRERKSTKVAANLGDFLAFCSLLPVQSGYNVSHE